MIQTPERSPERDAAIEAMLAHVPFDGWTRKALRLGLRDAGMAEDEAELLFPGGAVDMVDTFCDLMDRKMEDAAASLTENRLSHRVKAVIRLRLDLCAPYKEAIRRAMGVLAMPQGARTGIACTARTVDSIWFAAGDQSADFSWYTKRAILTAVYSATLLFWLRDQSEGHVDTLAFLDRRLAGVGRIGGLRRRAEAVMGRLRPA